MKKILYCLSVYTLSVLPIQAQTHVSGKITDVSANKGVPYVTVQAISLNKKYTTVAASDVLGNFIITVKSNGKYKFVFAAMGYTSDSLIVDINGQDKIDLGQIKLAEGEELKGAVVTARRLIMKDEGDRLVYDVLKDPEAKKLKMSEIMKKIPFMTVDATDGRLKYLNEKFPKITIDGQYNEMINSGRQFPMRLIRGDVMNRIEIIMPKTKDNPGDQPILNIKLERSLPDGYAAEITAKGNSDNEISAGIDVITKFNEVYVSFMYSPGYKYNTVRESNTVKEIFDNSVTVSKQIDSSKVWGNKTSHNFGIGGSYNLTKNDSFRGSISTSVSNDKSYNDALSLSYDGDNTLTNSKMQKSIRTGSTPPELNGVFEYSHEFKNRAYLIFSYNLAQNKDNNDYRIDQSDNANQFINIQNSSEKSSSADQSISMTFRKRYNKSNINFYTKYSDRLYNNSSRIEYNDALNGLNYIDVENEGLDYRQSIFSVRGQVMYMFKYFSFTLALNGENVNNRGTFHNIIETPLNYNEFKISPSLSLIYRTPDRTRIILSYDKNTLRPNINYLNPFENQSDPNNIFKGNPELKSEISHNFRFSVNKTFNEKLNMNLESGFALIDNAIEQYTSLNENNISITSYNNIAQRKEFAAALTLSLKPYKWLYISNDIQLSYNIYKNTLTNFFNKTHRFSNRLYLRFTISQKTTISANFNVLSTGNRSQTAKIKYYTNSSFYFSRAIINEKLFASIYITDPYKSNHRYSTIIGDELFRITSTREAPGRVIGFSIRWNFGRLKERQNLVNTPEVAPDMVRPSLITK